MRPLLWPVVLASSSPRRQELLKQRIAEFTIDPAEIDEDALTDADPWITAQRLAREKALTVFERHPGSLVIAGDTVVALASPLGYEQFAKPVDVDDARRMLSQLAGRTHLVITGLALRYPNGLIAKTLTTKVTLRPIQEAEAETYIATGEPMDKAGGYGIQGGAGAFIEKIEGSYTNVVGMPLEALDEALRDLRSSQ
ncbi:MAG TPA: Maf family protein [Fimbriimonadaceae bacterium]|nr:Maf family protein [Fimbriimonadaceae bacterium]HRJ32470.1 Maf family protein [Fimbriimonadaceae bacterium]